VVWVYDTFVLRIQPKLKDAFECSTIYIVKFQAMLAASLVLQFWFRFLWPGGWTHVSPHFVKPPFAGPNKNGGLTKWALQGRSVPLDPTFGSFTLLEPVSHYVNRFLWWMCLDCLDWNGLFWCLECEQSRWMYNILSIGRAGVSVMPCWNRAQEPNHETRPVLNLELWKKTSLFAHRFKFLRYNFTWEVSK